MADRYYVNSSLQPGLVTLSGQEAHHLAAVCRARPGDAVCLFNGDGADYPGTIVDVAKKHVTIDVTARVVVNRELAFALEVAAPLPKADRGDFLIEKLTELGVTRFVPLITERTIVHPRASRLESLQRGVIEASKQCGRNVLMQILLLTQWADYLSNPNLPPARWIGEPIGESFRHTGGDVAVAVGPEGGFTDDEKAAAVAAGWKTANLGDRILRVETAAIALATLCSIRT
jgi:16S rRNA (uracil1498-N3)-methyltransferase